MSEIKQDNYWNNHNDLFNIILKNQNRQSVVPPITDIFKDIERHMKSYQKSRKNSHEEVVEDDTEKQIINTPQNRYSENINVIDKIPIINNQDKHIFNKKERQTVSFANIQKYKITETEEMIEKSSYHERSSSNKNSEDEEPDDDMTSHLEDCEKLLENYYNQNYFDKDSKPIADRAMQTVRVKQIKFYSIQEIEYEDLGPELYSKYLIKYMQKQQKILIMNERKKIDEIIVKGQYSESLDLDKFTGRYYLYDNHTYQIVIRSIKNTEQLCRFKSQIKRTQPILFLQYQPEVLIVAGGYNRINKQQIVGCDKVQIFRLKKWIIQTPKIFKLQYGRISPIIFQMKIANAQSIVILGGNQYAEKIGQKFKYQNYQTQNVSVNSKASILTKDQITFALNQPSTNFKAFKNVNVKSQFSLNLYNGIVFKKSSPSLITHKRSDLILIIPSTNKVFKLKYNENINLLQICQTNQLLEHKQPIHPHSMNYQSNKLNQSVVYINNSGKLKNTQIKESNNQLHCLIF